MAEWSQSGGEACTSRVHVTAQGLSRLKIPYIERRKSLPLIATLINGFIFLKRKDLHPTHLNFQSPRLPNSVLSHCPPFSQSGGEGMEQGLGQDFCPDVLRILIFQQVYPTP